MVVFNDAEGMIGKRTLKAGGELNAKYPGGIENLTTRLAAEGHTIVRKGKRFLVKDYERAVASPKLSKSKHSGT